MMFAIATQVAADHDEGDQDQGFVSIFDGAALDGWDGDPEFWSVEDEAITGQTTPENPAPHNTFLVWRGGKLADFELQLKFRIVGGNSGIQYRGSETEKWVIAGYQADIDAQNKWTGILYDERGRGVLAKRGEEVLATGDNKLDTKRTFEVATMALVPVVAGEWNDYRIVADGNHLQHFVNGALTVDVIDEDAEHRAADGLLALQLHQGPPMKVQFKDISIRRLNAKTNAAEGANSVSKRIVFVAGKKSHGYGAHEHNAGCVLLAKELERALPGYTTDVYLNGWPANPATAFANADAVVMYCDGGKKHMV
jgi:hypothetical protein